MRHHCKTIVTDVMYERRWELIGIMFFTSSMGLPCKFRRIMIDRISNHTEKF